MAIKKTTYIIEVDTKSGKIKIDGITKGFERAEVAAKKLNTTLRTTGKNMGQTIDKTGLAGAAVVELGRTISDSNFGMTAMANNISQLSTLFITLTVTAGGFTKGLKAMWAVMKGPLGLILAFQVVITLMEKMAIEAKKSTASVMSVALAYKNAATELEVLLEVDNDLTDSEIDNIELRILALKEEARVRAQLVKIQNLQKKILDLQGEEAKAGLNWWQGAMESMITGTANLLDDTFKGAKIQTGPVREKLGIWQAILWGEGGFKQDEKVADLEQQIQGVIDGIDPDVIKRITDKKGKKGKEREKIEAFKNITVFDLDEEAMALALDKHVSHMKAEIDLAQKWRAVEAKNKDKFDAEQKAKDEEAFDHKMKLFDAIGLGLHSLGIIVGESTQEGKAIAAAGALIDTWAAINKTMAVYGGTPLGWAQSIAIGLAGFANVKKIYDVQVPGQSGGGGSVPTPDAAEIQAPDFNIVGGSGINQLRDVIIGELNKPNKVFITSKDVRTAAELDRNIVVGATVG